MEKVRIQDDLYTYVNQEWMEKAIIPEDRPTVGGFADLDKDVEKLMIGEFNSLSESKEYPSVYLERACTLYSIAKNTKKRNKDGIKPVLKTLARIEKIKDIKYFNRVAADLVLENIPLPFKIMVDVDMKDTSKHCVFIQGPSVILPDVTYYKEEMAQQKNAILGMWSSMAKQILAKTKLSEEDQNKYIEDTLAFDALIATLVKSNEEWSEYAKMYNPFKTSKVNSLLKPIKFKKLLEKLFGQIPEVVIVAEPRYFKEFNKVFNEETFVLYKHWAYVMKLISSCSYLSEELRDIGGSYMRALSGVAAMPNVEKFAYNLASSVYSEPIGLYYGEKYFGEEAKKDVIEMVHEIIDTYKERVKNNDFLMEATKEKAILKLEKIEVKMGYPDKVDPFFDELVFDESDSLFNIVSSLSKIEKKHNFDELNKEVRRDKWVMPGHMVNACYNPFSNDITFPAAILQAPFYSIKQTRSQNLGGIGAVIGHEISHAFDNNGAKFDENGNLNNWWTKEDNKKFIAKTKAMIKQFDGIELPWGKVNGSFIVSENIADNGGMAVTLDIMKRMENASYEEYFVNWAKVWCMKAKEEYLKLLLAVDVHGPNVLRANMPPRNFEEWYKTFNVTAKDKMFIVPNKRVVIW